MARLSERERYERDERLLERLASVDSKTIYLLLALCGWLSFAWEDGRVIEAVVMMLVLVVGARVSRAFLSWWLLKVGTWWLTRRKSRAEGPR